MRVFANSGGSLALTSSFAKNEDHYNPAGGDWDGNADLDLAVGNSGASIRVYRNRAADIQALPDTAPRVRIAYPVGAAAPFFSSATILQGPTVAITYTLADPESDPVRYIQAHYSLDGGSTWQPAVAASGTPTTNLTTSPTGTVHVYTWDVYASGIYGSSDTTVFRIDAYQGFTGPGPYQIVANVPAGLSLWARLFPVTDPAPPAITLTATAGQYAGAFHLAEPALEGYVQVWVDEADPRREIVTDYALGGDPGYVRGRGGYVRGRPRLGRGKRTRKATRS